MRAPVMFLPATRPDRMGSNMNLSRTWKNLARLTLLGAMAAAPALAEQPVTRPATPSSADAITPKDQAVQRFDRGPVGKPLLEKVHAAEARRDAATADERA